MLAFIFFLFSGGANIDPVGKTNIRKGPEPNNLTNEVSRFLFSFKDMLGHDTDETKILTAAYDITAAVT